MRRKAIMSVMKRQRQTQVVKSYIRVPYSYPSNRKVHFSNIDRHTHLTLKHVISFVVINLIEYLNSLLFFFGFCFYLRCCFECLVYAF